MASRPLRSRPCKNSLQRSRRHSTSSHTGLSSQILALALRRRANGGSDCELICLEAYVGGKRTRRRRDSKQIYDLSTRPGLPLVRPFSLHRPKLPINDHPSARNLFLADPQRPDRKPVLVMRAA